MADIQIDPKNWDKKKFIAFILILASNADMNLSPEEKAFIMDKLGPQAYNKALSEYKKYNDFEHIRIVMQLKELYLPDKKSRRDLFNDLKEVIESDHHVASMESEVVKMLERLIEK